jgi:hypothetical protein
MTPCPWCRTPVRTHQTRIARHTRITTPQQTVTGWTGRQIITCTGSGKRWSDGPNIVRRPEHG